MIWHLGRICKKKMHPWIFLCVTILSQNISLLSSMSTFLGVSLDSKISTPLDDGHDLLLGSDEQLLQVVWPLHWNLVLGDRNGFNGAIRSTPAPSRWSPAGKARRTTPTGDSTTSIQPARLGQLYDWHYHRYGHGDHYWLMFENVKKVLPLSPIIILNSNVRSGHSTGEYI